MIQREVISGLQYIRVICGTKDLSFVSAPFRMVDAINPVLHFNHNTAVLLGYARARLVFEEALRLLQCKSAYKLSVTPFQYSTR